MTYSAETFFGRMVAYKTTHGSTFRLGRSDRQVLSFRTTNSTVRLPRATWCRMGTAITVVKYASGNVTVANADGTTIETITTLNQARTYVLTSNTSSAGVWRLLHTRTVNTARAAGLTHGSSTTNPATPTTYTPTCPKFFVLRSCGVESEIVTDTDLLSYVGDVVRVSEGVGCFTVDIWTGVDPAVPVAVTILGSDIDCGSITCGLCTTPGVNLIQPASTADMVASGAWASATYIYVVNATFIEPGVGPGLYTATIPRTLPSNVARGMTYDFDAGDIDISTVDAITVTFRATVVANGCCDNSGGIDLVINWGSDYTWVRVEPYGHDYSTGDYYGDVEATIVWRREPGNVFDFKVAESSFVYSGADVSIAETYSDINESDIDLAAMKVVMGAACGQGCYDQAQGLEYVIHSFTITQLKVCFEVTEAP